MSKAAYAIVAGVLLALAGWGAWWWWQARDDAAAQQAAATAAAPAVQTVQPPLVTDPASAAESAAPAASAVVHPIEAASQAASAAAAPALDMPATLKVLFGRKAVLTLLQTDDFAHRVVATVDNLGRERAPSRLWPVNPTGGRFTVLKQGDRESISPDNGLRYTAFVLLLEEADLRQVAAAYVRFYPAFQKAYEELGFPGRYFNDRLVEVIDQLLATPQVREPIAVRLLEVNSPYALERPWVLYEFEDPALRALTAGQKILLRMGAVNARRVQARLAAFRDLVARRAPRR